MKGLLVLICFIPVVVLISQNNPPPDYIEKDIIVEDNYHVFFNFSNGTNTFKTQSGWDIAFYNEIHEVGGKINDNRDVRLWRVNTDTSQFNAIGLCDTSVEVKNDESIFYRGALDTLYSGTLSTYFNIGIGNFYTDPSFKSIPTKIFIIKREDNVYGKFYVSYSSSPNRSFAIRYSDIDNSNANTYTVSKVTPMTKHYTYVKLKDGSVLSDYETKFDNWDIMFRPYSAGNVDYPAGVLTNNAHNLIRISNVSGFPDDYLKQGVVKTECYEAIGDPISVQYNGSLNSSNPILRTYDQIGGKWFNTSTNQPNSGRSYFIKDRTDKIWHLVFTSYNAASKTVSIAYQSKGSASIQSSGVTKDLWLGQRGTRLQIENANFNGTATNLRIYNIHGQLIHESKLFQKKELDVSNWRNSIVFIHSEANKSSMKTKFFVR